MSVKLENDAIIRLVKQHKIRDQSEFLVHLRMAGIDMPQSTLSRRLKRLNVIKVQDYYKVLQEEAVARTPLLHIKAAAPNLLVLHTLPGHASSLAFQLDQKIYPVDGAAEPEFSGLLGTIAGDDTVLVIIRDESALERVMAVMATWLV